MKQEEKKTVTGRVSCIGWVAIVWWHVAYAVYALVCSLLRGCRFLVSLYELFCWGDVDWVGV